MKTIILHILNEGVSMYEIIEVEALSSYRVRVKFKDGVEGEVDLSDRLFGPMFEPLKDPDFFASVYIDEFGVICWPNKADIAPDTIYKQLITKH
jgi:hypothetical protein